MFTLTKEETAQIQRVEDYTRSIFMNEESGHDFGHILRVVNNTKKILTNENAFVAILVAYLHDIMDDKLFDISDENEFFNTLWEKLDLDSSIKEVVFSDIQSIGYKGGFNTSYKSPEAQIVSDADLLEAMGAIGIARTFYYAGNKGIPFHDYTLEGIVATNIDEYRNLKRNSSAHFDEKLLKLVEAIQTEKAKTIAIKRHQIIVEFYQNFLDEITID